MRRLRERLRYFVFGSTDPNFIPEEFRFISATQFFVLYWFVLVPILTLLTFTFITAVTAITMWIVNTVVDSELTLNWLVISGLFGLSIYVNLPNTLTASLVVPNQHVAVLTIFGQRMAWFLNEGKYPDITTGAILGRSQETVNDFTTDESSPNGPGFVNMGRLSFQLWNDMKGKSPLLTNVARNGAQVITTVLIVLRVRNPNLVLSADEPSKEVFERARTAIRSGNSFFTDKDNAFVKTILVKLMMGKTIITAFVNSNSTTNYENGSVIRDYGGKAIIMEIEDEELEGLTKTERETKIETYKDEFRVILENEADADMLELVPHPEGKKLVVYDKSVDQSIEEVLHPNGIELESASVSNVQFSPEVSAAANRAASEVYQAKSMRDSAIAQVKAEGALNEGRERNKYYPDDIDKVIVAAQDNDRVKIVHVSGSGGDLAKAASLISNSGSNKE